MKADDHIPSNRGYVPLAIAHKPLTFGFIDIECERMRGGSIRDCACKTADGWLECPPEARRNLYAAPQLITDIEPEPRTPQQIRSRVAAERKELATAARQSGYTGNLCDNCGSTKMRQGGTCEFCEDCGTTGGCS